MEEDRTSVRVTVANLTEGGLSGGYSKYLDHMLPLLCKDPRIEELSVLVPECITLRSAENAKVLSWRTGRAWSSLGAMKKLVRGLEPDVVFIPTGRWMDCGGPPIVAMIRNMEPLTIPIRGNAPPEGLRNLVRAYLARTSCRRATRVIAVSRHVRDFLIHRWGINADKIGLVYHGIEPPPDPRDGIMPMCLARSGHPQFIFSAGSIRPARGLEDIIGAMARLSILEQDVRLVIAGSPDRGTRGYLAQMQRMAGGLGLSARITWAGQLTAREMSWCFYNCRVFVISSRAEACPNTLLEAMTHGCSIVSTKSPPMPEFLADSALFYEPGDPEDLAAKLRTALMCQGGSERGVGKLASDRAKEYQWKETAEKTVQELLLAVEDRQRTRESAKGSSSDRTQPGQ